MNISSCSTGQPFDVWRNLDTEGRVAKVADFCNGTCPSTPGSSGLPRYGQTLVPSVIVVPEDGVYAVVVTFGGAYYDRPRLVSLSPEGVERWTLTTGLPTTPQASYWLQIRDGKLWVFSTYGDAGNIVVVSLTGTVLGSLKTAGTPSFGPDRMIFAIDTPHRSGGSRLLAMDSAGEALWNYSDGRSAFHYLEISGGKPDGEVCMPASAGSNFSVVCLDLDGHLVRSEMVSDSRLRRFDLIGDAGHFVVRKMRDNVYMHKGKNEMYSLGTNGSSWVFDFPDDVNFVGPISYLPGGGLVVLTRPDCLCRPDSLVALGPKGELRWNVTLPGRGDAVTNPAYPPQFGPMGARNGMTVVSTVQKSQDPQTFDMWYSAVDESGALAWKLPIAGITDLTRLTYAGDDDGNFYVVVDGVLYKVAAAARGAAASVLV